MKTLKLPVVKTNSKKIYGYQIFLSVKSPAYSW
jgi:hypothetical protein